MYSGKLWPVHPHPYPNELLSSWLVRIAHANGEKVQTFTHQEFGLNKQVWNRDIDRLAPEWLLERLSEKTATPIDVVRQTTLKRYEGVLFYHSTEAGVEAWVTPLGMYHRKRKGFGIQFCPLCLKEGDEPYFRTTWRVAFQTFCPIHLVMLHDRCPECFEPIAFHRIEVGKDAEAVEQKLCICSNCQFDFRNAEVRRTSFIECAIEDKWSEILAAIAIQEKNRRNKETLEVLHHFSKLLCSREASKKLFLFFESLFDIKLTIPNGKNRTIESYGVLFRHQTISLALWLLNDWPQNLFLAWLDGAVRYNFLLKDFTNPPKWYTREVAKMNVNYKKRLILKQKYMSNRRFNS
ncbi:TniQ family protein [Hydrogenovibrio sp. JE_KL2]|uniref:TniQ family protein n=1 Tax=Hydrogenovibrio sp. JE_KL2 TaxID=2651188 RepID=UPI00128DF85D|nr:TniQ family protein [Hydrogenovibrio sp. JE_KL2]MPQ76831.1 TniQ family protein [Hydrogenovibrio sp. JE_KL2]